jgi:nitrogenase molybdenum-iron protein alpha/beta subunit
LAYDDQMGRTIRDFLRREFGAEFLEEAFPVGFAESERWVAALAARFGKQALARGVTEEYRRRYDAEAAALRPWLAGKRLMLTTISHNIDWVLRAATDTGMTPVFVGIVNYSQDDRFETEFAGTIGELRVNYNPARRAEDIGRVKPDILVSNYDMAETGDRRCLADTIPLCPDNGFLSGISLVRRWSELFKSNLKEGWKDDCELYRQYFA